MGKKSLFFASIFAAMLLMNACNDTSKETETEETETQTTSETLIALSGDTVSKMNGCVLASQYAAGETLSSG